MTKKRLLPDAMTLERNDDTQHVIDMTTTHIGMSSFSTLGLKNLSRGLPVLGYVNEIKQVSL